MKHDDKLDDIRAWIEPPSPDDAPEDGYEEWLEEEIARGLADAKAGRLTPLSEVKKQLFADREALGETVSVGGFAYQIIGVMREKNQDSSYDGQDVSKVFVPFASILRDFPNRPPAKPTSVDRIIVTPKTLAVQEAAKAQVRRTLGRLYDFDPRDEEAAPIWDTVENAVLVAGFTAREHVRAFRQSGSRSILTPIDHRNVLPCEHEANGPFSMRHRHAPGFDRFGSVARPQDHEVGHRAQAGQLLDRLVGRAVFPERDAVVRPYVDHARPAQRREPDGGAHVVGERQEGGAEGHNPAVQRHPRHRRRHGVLAQTVMDVASRESPGTAGDALGRHALYGRGRGRALEVAAPLQGRAGRGVEIRRAAHQVRYGARQRVDHRSARVAGRHFPVPGREDREVRLPAGRQLAPERAREALGQLGMRDAAALPCARAVHSCRMVW